MITSEKRLSFKSEFFGTFAVSRVLIGPEPIDWDDVTANFSTYLAASPWVLTVMCVTFGVSVIVLVCLRRLDREDQHLVSITLTVMCVTYWCVLTV